MKKIVCLAVLMLTWTVADLKAQDVRDSVAVREQMMKNVDAHYLDSIEHYYNSIQTELGTVTVSAVKPLVKMEADKMAYDVANDVDAKSSTVLEMLRKVPMVSVDGQDNITVNGSGAFKVYVDGKPNPMFSQNASQIFKMMPASAVSKIEVITNPGAKYDAEGATGILNIVLAKAGGASSPDMNGATATVRAGTGTRGGYNGGASLTAQEGKLSVSVNAFTYYQRLKGLDVDFTQHTLANGGGTTSNMFHGNQRTHFSMGSLNLSYDIDTLNTISGSVGVNAFQVKGNHLPEVSMTGPAFGEGMAYTYRSANRSGSTSLDASADWQHFFGGNREKYITFSYLLSHNPQDDKIRQEYNQPSAFTDTYNHNRPRSTEHTFQVDYTSPVGAGQVLSVGSKFIMRNSRSKSEYYNLIGDEQEPLADQWEDYRYKNRIAAAYAEYALSKGVFDAKAGLRYEHTWQEVAYKMGSGSDFDKDYGNLVPSLTLSMRPGMTKNLGLTYNMRISRPGITYMNPYVDRSNPINIQYGNTHLDVEKTHNIGLTYSSFTPKLMYNLSLQQGLSNNEISSYSFYDDQILNTTYGNIVERRTTSLNFFANWLMLAKTRLMVNGSLSYAHLQSDQLEQRNHGWQGNLMANVQQTLPWDVKLGLFYVYNGRNYSLQGYNGDMNIAGLTLSKSFIGERLNLSLQGIAPIGHGGDLHINVHSKGKDFTSLQHISVPISEVRFTVSYTFGKMGVKAKTHQSRIENDFSEKKSDGQTGGVTGATGGMGM